MGTDTGSGVAELLPTATWDHLEKDPEAVLIDVRSKPEWGFVGTPDLSTLGRSVLCIEWAEYPDMSVNPRFVDRVKEELGGTLPSRIFFLCRSGARSLRAAEAVKDAFSLEGKTVDCVNVAEGFEGDLDPQKHRGGLNGWKARGLPWRQS